VPWRTSPEPGRVEISNPSDGGFWFWLFKFYAFAGLCLVGLAFLGGVGLYVHFADTLPRLPDFDRYRLEAAESTRLRAWDGTELAELASERREILPLEAFPKKLLQSFVAIEDRRFYEHGGLDYRGMLRAFVANLRADYTFARWISAFVRVDNVFDADTASFGVLGDPTAVFPTFADPRFQSPGAPRAGWVGVDLRH